MNPVFGCPVCRWLLCTSIRIIWIECKFTIFVKSLHSNESFDVSIWIFERRLNDARLSVGTLRHRHYLLVTVLRKIDKLDCAGTNWKTKDFWKPGTVGTLFYYYYYPPSSGIASCVGTAQIVTWRLHLTRPCCVALGQVLIWLVSLDWFEEHLNHHSAIYPMPLQYWNYCNTQAQWACLIASTLGSIS